MALETCARQSMSLCSDSKNLFRINGLGSAPQPQPRSGLPAPWTKRGKEGRRGGGEGKACRTEYCLKTGHTNCSLQPWIWSLVGVRIITELGPVQIECKTAGSDKGLQHTVASEYCPSLCWFHRRPDDKTAAQSQRDCSGPGIKTSPRRLLAHAAVRAASRPTFCPSLPGPTSLHAQSGTYPSLRLCDSLRDISSHAFPEAHLTESAHAPVSEIRTLT